MRVAIVGGNGKTGRAVASALAGRDVEAVPLGTGRLGRPRGCAGGLRGGVRRGPELDGDAPGEVV